MKVKEAKYKEEIFQMAEDTYEVWNNSLSLKDYLKYQLIMLENDWAKKNSKYIYLEEKKQIISSLKLYQVSFMLNRRRYKGYEICAVYTKKEFRNKGYASYLIEYVIKNYDGFLFLYSDISTQFYKRFGFIEVPTYKTTVDINRKIKTNHIDYEKREYPPYTLFYYRNEDMYIQKERGFYNYRYERYLSFIRFKYSNYVREYFINIFGVGEAYVRAFRHQAILLDYIPINYANIKHSIKKIFEVLVSFNIKKIVLWGTKLFLSSIIEEVLEKNKKNIPMILVPREIKKEIEEIIKNDSFYICKADFL